MWFKKNIIYFYILCLVYAAIPSFSQAQMTTDKRVVLKKENNVTLEFKKIPVRDLVQFLADSMNYNLIMSESVGGSVSLHFRNVSWEKTLDTVLDMAGLVKKQTDNILVIGTPAEFALRQQNLSEASLYKMVNVPLKHIDVAELVTLLRTQAELVSSSAKISANSRDNHIWIKDNAENIPQILRFIHQVDIPAQQILITAKIVNIDDNKISELGLKFKNKKPDNFFPKSLHTNLPEENTLPLTFVIANLAQNKLLDLELSALESSGYSKLIANPRLITQNHKQATIEAGEEIPYQEKTSSGATSINFKKAALSLKVLPILTPDNNIVLELEISQNKTSSLAINGTPGIQTQELKTQVIVQDGQTVILGGIYEKSASELVSKTPIVGDIPLIGKLFNHYEKNENRKQLLIFVTPQVFREDDLNQD